MSKSLSLEEFLLRLKQHNPNLELLGEYTKLSARIKVKCSLDGYVWEPIASSIVSGISHCPRCAGVERLTHDQYVEKLKQAKPNIELLGLYKNATTKTQFRCLVDGHEWFTSQPNQVFKRNGCPKCAGNLKVTESDFLERFSKSKHRDKIELIGEFKSHTKKLRVRCLVDGHEWNTTPQQLCSGIGCRVCFTNSLRLEHNQFVENLKVRQPSITVIGQYEHTKKKIRVRCNIDGYEWDVLPNSLMSGSGCAKCARVLQKDHATFMEEFSKLNKPIEILTEYTQALSKVKARCLIDGYEWYPTPAKLLSGQGCPKCYGNIKKTHEECVEIAYEHNDNIEIIGRFEGVDKKTDVSCTVCSHKWLTTLSDIKRGRGCPKCAKTGFDRDKPAHFYVVSFSDVVGFGISNYVKERLWKHKTTISRRGWSMTVLQVYSGSGADIEDMEIYLKNKLPIYNAGVKGFKTESVEEYNAILLFRAIDEFRFGRDIVTLDKDEKV